MKRYDEKALVVFVGPGVLRVDCKSPRFNAYKISPARLGAVLKEIPGRFADVEILPGIRALSAGRENGTKGD